MQRRKPFHRGVVQIFLSTHRLRTCTAGPDCCASFGQSRIAVMNVTINSWGSGVLSTIDDFARCAELQERLDQVCGVAAITSVGITTARTDDYNSRTI